MPVGLKRRTAIIIPKIAMSLKTEEKYCVENTWAPAMMNDPRTAPERLPIPPKITAAKAINNGVIPMAE
jgi:hypothetical protein